MKPVVIHTKAKAELDAAIGYYEKRKPGLGVDLRLEVEKAVSKVQQNPNIRSPYKATAFRYWVLRRFPYVIYYRELDDCIWVVAIAHGKRRPDYWYRRKPEKKEN